MSKKIFDFYCSRIDATRHRYNSSSIKFALCYLRRLRRPFGPPPPPAALVSSLASLGRSAVFSSNFFNIYQKMTVCFQNTSLQASPKKFSTFFKSLAHKRFLTIISPKTLAVLMFFISFFFYFYFFFFKFFPLVKVFCP